MFLAYNAILDTESRFFFIDNSVGPDSTLEWGSSTKCSKAWRGKLELRRWKVCIMFLLGEGELSVGVRGEVDRCDTRNSSSSSIFFFSSNSMEAFLADKCFGE